MAHSRGGDDAKIIVAQNAVDSAEFQHEEVARREVRRELGIGEHCR